MTLRPQAIGPNGPALFEPGRHDSVRIVLLSGIGDVVHGLPLANDLKRIDPSIRVEWVAEPAPAQVLLHHTSVDRVVVYASRNGMTGLRTLSRDLAGSETSLTLNAQRYLKSAWPTLFSRSPLRVGLPPSKTRDGISLIHTHVLEETPWKHTQDLCLDFRGALGVVRDHEPEWRIGFSAQEDAEARTFFSALDARPTIGLVLASANPAKDWPAERYRRLADALAHDFDAQVLLIGGPSKAERQVATVLLNGMETTPRDCLGDNVRRMMWLVAGCDLLISPDTGPLHIAHALNVPVIGLFGHTNPWRVGPYSRFHDLVIDRYTEAGDEPDPSGYLPKDGRMDAISVDDVLFKVEVARSRYP